MAHWERLAVDGAPSANRSDLAWMLEETALTLAELGRSDEALVCHQRAMAVNERLARERPRESKHLAQLARNHHNLGALHGDADRLAEALACFERAEEANRQLLALAPGKAAHQRGLAFACREPQRTSSWADATRESRRLLTEALTERVERELAVAGTVVALDGCLLAGDTGLVALLGARGLTLTQLGPPGEATPAEAPASPPTPTPAPTPAPP